MTKFSLTAKQLEAREMMRNQNIKHAQLEGGSRSGKTLFWLRVIGNRAMRAPASRHAVLRFRFNHCKQSIVYDTWPKMMGLCFPGLKAPINHTDWFAEFPNRSQVWFGGLDDKERTEKILGNEYATILLNETSQMTFASRNLVMTRLAQKAQCTNRAGALIDEYLRLLMLYDLNPGENTHWSARLFKDKVDPITKNRVARPEQFASMRINPIDNIENLPDGYMDTLADLPARQQKRFLYGEYTDANEDALFDEVTFSKWRELSDPPDMQRIVIAVDPSGADAEDADADAIGIVVAGMGTDGNGYLLEDLTLKAGPGKWGAVVSTAYENHQADMIVGETNYGGAMVEAVIQGARRSDMPRMPFTKVTATRGKVVRSEPISAIVEKGKIRHVGYFHELEDELCGFTTHGYTGSGSPNRADAYVWAFSYLFPGLTKRDKPDAPKKKRRPVYEQTVGWMGA